VDYGLVGPGGLEPPTSPLSGVRSSQLSYGPMLVWVAGGAGRDRTGDLLNANQALSQLSYSPLRKKLIEADWMQGPSAGQTIHSNSLRRYYFINNLFLGISRESPNVIGQERLPLCTCERLLPRSL
jgi:hypothetical protein